jgi:hypothetical protein
LCIAGCQSQAATNPITLLNQDLAAGKTAGNRRGAEGDQERAAEVLSGQGRSTELWQIYSSPWR